MSKIRVVLVEDHTLSRIGLKAALEQVEGIQVVGDAANAHQGFDAIATTQPDVAIVDIGLPDMDGIELTQRLKQAQADNHNPKTKVLILTMHKSEASVLAAFAAGADSYSLKDVSLENLVQAIQVTYEGNAWIDPAIARVVLQQARTQESTSEKEKAEDPQAKETSSEETRIDDSFNFQKQEIGDYFLTERELEVLELIVAGCNNAQIAEKLYITVGTVKTHVKSLLNKLCADDHTQTAVRTLRSGLVA